MFILIRQYKTCAVVCVCANTFFKQQIVHYQTVIGMKFDSEIFHFLDVCPQMLCSWNACQGNVPFARSSLSSALTNLYNVVEKTLWSTPTRQQTVSGNGDRCKLQRNTVSFPQSWNCCLKLLLKKMVSFHQSWGFCSEAIVEKKKKKKKRCHFISLGASALKLLLKKRSFFFLFFFLFF